MNVVDLIRKKREGTALNDNELRTLIEGYVESRIPDYQMSAFLMACYFRGMSEEETYSFTRLMLQSGATVDLSDIPGVKVDKHSTGGVGDKVSLILAPMVAACGVPVPMISGRGLGHTGGTLDKLESIPGFRTDLSITEYRRIIREIGLVMIGQTAEIAPADKKMYALRDVTATVECIPLIAGSIMSKKLAEGIDALVLDIKTGRGSFMQTPERSLELAKTLVSIGNRFGKKTVGFITDMSQPLGTAIGNWLEVAESIECLRGAVGNGDGAADLMEVTYLLSGTMVYLGGKAGSIDEGIGKCKQAVENGSAFGKFLRLVEAQGGSVAAVENLESAPLPKFAMEVRSVDSGFVGAIDSFELGLTGIVLGAGREKMDDRIDPKAGILLRKKVGDAVETGDALAVFYTDRENVLSSAHGRIAKAFKISPAKPEPKRLVLNIVDKNGAREWNQSYDPGLGTEKSE
jgi:pyrimidine-nucleoside phosphorylase